MRQHLRASVSDVKATVRTQGLSYSAKAELQQKLICASVSVFCGIYVCLHMPMCICIYNTNI